MALVDAKVVDAATLVAIAAAVVVGLFHATDFRSEIVDRISASRMDYFFIALFSGLAGTYAFISPRIHEAVAGIAISVALIPPVVMLGISDPIGSGLVRSLNRPGTSVTGMSLVNTDLGGKRLALLKEIVPSLTDVGLLVLKNHPPTPLLVREMEAASKELKLKLHVLELENLDELQEARLGERLSSGARDVRSAFHERAELAAAGTPSEPPTGGCTAFRARVLDGRCLRHRRTVRGPPDGVRDNSGTICSQVPLKVTE